MEFGRGTAHVFMQWKVPSRLTDVRLPDGAQAGRYVPDIGDKSTQIGSRVSRRETSSRFSTLRCAQSRQQSRSNDNVGLGESVEKALSLEFKHSNKSLSSPARKRKALVDNTVKRDVNYKGYGLPQRAIPSQKYLIEKGPKSEEGTTPEMSLAKSLQPDAKNNVMQWMKTSSEQDRKLAVKFFQSLSGNKLIGDNSKDQNTSINQVNNTLKRNKATGTDLPSGSPRDDRGKQLQYLRLLTENTREKRWMHTTWHHLPSYHNIDPVNNRSAIYTEMKSFPPRHFTIHPEWGP